MPHWVRKEASAGRYQPSPSAAASARVPVGRPGRFDVQQALARPDDERSEEGDRGDAPGGPLGHRAREDTGVTVQDQVDVVEVLVVQQVRHVRHVGGDADVRAEEVPVFPLSGQARREHPVAGPGEQVTHGAPAPSAVHGPVDQDIVPHDVPPCLASVPPLTAP